MTQHQINLLPDAIRARGEAGLRTGRYVGAIALAAATVIVVSSYAKFSERAAKVRLDAVQQQADLVFRTERRSAELEKMLNVDSKYVDTYAQVALPLPVSGIVATLIADLPESVSLDRFDLKMTTPRVARSPRSKGDEPAAPPTRYLNGEISGFAATDQDITRLVTRLQDLTFLENVNLDFTRSREVREQAAREFRLSFRININVRYDAAMLDDAAFAAAQEVGHVD